LNCGDMNMSKKLLEDPKVAALVEKAESNATKAETKRVRLLIDEIAADNKENKCKTSKKAVAGCLKDLKAAIKAA